jgi:glycine cleavage system regulatory protein
MRTHLVVTITCPDRPGIVEQITEALVGFSANWEESRMARLGGDFAGIVKIGVSQEQADSLSEALRGLEDSETTVTVKVAHDPGASTLEGYALYELRLVGADHEGIVHTVSRYLVDQGINVEEMETQVVPAPMSASPLFQMEARIKVPPQLSLADLNANLQRIGEELGVDIEVGSCRE